MRVVQEETFAPVLPIQSFESADDALARANDSPFGLNASVWSSDADRCERAAGRLQTGNVYANGVLTNIGNPHLPFGGVKASGIGSYHGPEGLRAFCRTTSVMTGRGKREPHWFPHTSQRISVIDRLIALRYGDPGFFRRIKGWLDLGRDMT